MDCVILLIPLAINHPRPDDVSLGGYSIPLPIPREEFWGDHLNGNVCENGRR